MFTGSIDTIISSIGDAIDKNVTNDEEKLMLRNELFSIKQKGKVEATKLSNAYEKSVTKRWLSDNESIITRLVRPIITIFVYLLFGAVVLTDGNIGEFQINAAYIPVLQTLLVTVTVAYFGSRGLEKTTKIFKKV